MAPSLDYQKMPANEVAALFAGPTGAATGITDVGEPLADELNNTGGTSGVLNISPATSFNDFGFGTQASETTNEPSLSDASTFEEFGQSNFGGTISPYYPRVYDDASNIISLTYDLLEVPGTLIDVALRVDGDIDDQTPVADGDFVSVWRVQREAEQNPFTPGESKRYVAGFIQKSEFAHMIPVGDQAITAIEPASYAAGSRGRIRASIQGRDVTNMLTFSTTDAAVIDVYAGGFFEVTGSAAETADVTISHPFTADTATVSVVVS